MSHRARITSSKPAPRASSLVVARLAALSAVTLPLFLPVPEAAAQSKRKAETGPLVINVSLRRQRLSVYDATRRIATSPVSSGRRGRSTPTGVYSIVQKRRHHISNIYNVSMPNMQRITWSGIALHAGVLPGYPASSGCIRLPHGFSRELFRMTTMGTRVIVTRDPVEPVAFAHERLFSAYPADEEIAQRSLAKAPTRLADASRVTGGAKSESGSPVLGDTAGHALETVSTRPPLSEARKRFVERRAAAAGKRAVALRTAGYAVLSTRDKLRSAEREATAAQASLERLGTGASGLSYLEDVEAAVAGARAEIAQLEAPAVPEEDEDASGTRAERTDPSAAERAQRIATLRLEIEDAELEIAPLRSKVAELRAARTVAERRASAAERELNAAKEAADQAKAFLDKALADEASIKKQAAKRDLPVSVFVSRERQRLYVRQGYEDIFDVEVAFRNPDAPVGTHVFTALDYAPEIAGMTWTAVSVPYDPSRRKKRSKDEASPVSLEAQTAAAALERFEIPEEARERIADVMKPGSSMVISDFRLSNETGKYTDFIGTIR